MSDIGKRFREEARLTEEDCSVELTNLQYRAQAGEDIRWDKVSAVIKNAQLNKLLSTKLDNGRYVLALIDTRGRFPPTSIPTLRTDVIAWRDKELLREGYNKVVHVFGEGE
jgi:hypothetical protein